ncbi:MAG: hypothetical protein R3F61_00670 [Myxococcota bacterium]
MSISLLLMTAWGADLVLFGDGVPPVAVLARISAATKKDAGEFELMSLREWASQLEPQYAGGELRACQGAPVHRAWFEERLQEASDSVRFFDSDRAMGALTEIEDALPCADETLSRDLVGRAFFLKGMVEYTVGAEADAAQSYADARSMDRLMRFDTSMSPDSRDAFEDATPDSTAVWIEIRPKPDRVWLDGEQVTYGDQGFQVARGRHHVTVESSATTSADIRVEEGGALLLPRMIGDRLVAEIDQPRRRAAFLQMIAYAGQERAYLSDIEHVWIAEKNKNSVKELGVEEAPEKEPGRRGRYTPAGLAVAGGGLVVGGVGTALFAACDRCTAGGLGLIGVGSAAALTGAGIVIADQVSVSPTFGPRGVGVQLSVPLR